MYIMAYITNEGEVGSVKGSTKDEVESKFIELMEIVDIKVAYLQKKGKPSTKERVI